MTVGGIHHDHVHARAHQRRHSLLGIAAGADRRADPQPTPFVLAGDGEIAGFLNVLDRDHAAQLEAVVDHQHLLDAMLVEQGNDFLAAGPLVHRHQPLLWGHHRADRRAHVRLETQVAVGDDADQFLALHHRQSGKVVGAGQFHHLVDSGARVDDDGIVDHPALEFLDPPYFLRLFLDRHVLMDNADAAFLRQGNGQSRFSHRVHRRRHQRNIEGNGAGQLGLEAHVLGQHRGISRKKQDIIEGQGFLNNAHGETSGLGEK